MAEQRFTLSISTLLLASGIVAAFFLCWQLRSLIVILMIAVVLAASIAPIVRVGERLRLPRWLSVILAYLSLLAGLSGVLLLIGPTVFAQIELLLRQMPTYSERIRQLVETLMVRLSASESDLLNQVFDTQSVTSWAIRSSQQVLLRSYSLTRGLVGGIFSLILAIFLSGYIVADSFTLSRSLVRLFPAPWDKRLEAQLSLMGDRMGGYIRGRLLVSAILGIATAVGLGFLGLQEFSIGLGAIAAVTNLIPFLGPILGAVPALIVAIAQGGWIFLWVLLLFVIIQNIETYILDPLLVGSSVGVHPLYQLLSVLGGVQLLGIVGALILPPWFAGTAVLLENLYLRPKLITEKRMHHAETNAAK